MLVRNFIFKVEAPTISVVAYFSDLSRLQNAFNVPLSEIANFYDYLFNSSFDKISIYSLKADGYCLQVSALPLDYISPKEFEKVRSLTGTNIKK